MTRFLSPKDPYNTFAKQLNRYIIKYLQLILHIACKLFLFSFSKTALMLKDTF